VAVALTALGGTVPPPRRAVRVVSAVRYLPARVSVHADRVVGELGAGVLGSNIQFVHGGDGILDPATGRLREAAVAELAQLHLGTIRFPGGSYSQGYHWRDGVGPREGRPTTVSYFDGQPLANDYGTDEHMELCRRLGARVTITVNFESGTPQEAANWVEYVNGEVPAEVPADWREDSWGGGDAAPAGYFAWLRARFGHPEPYGVERWEVGNEVYDRWSETYTAAAYARRFVEFAEAMKVVDPSIRVAAVGFERADDPWKPGDAPWNRTVASIAGRAMDALHVHTYGPVGDGRTILLMSSGAVETSVTVDRTASSTLSFPAQGFNSLGAYPLPDGRVAILRVAVDGEVVRDVALDRLRGGVYSVPLELGRGTHTLSLAFVNDVWDPAHGLDLDVMLDRTVTLAGPDGTRSVELADLGDAARSAMAVSAVFGRQLGRIREILRETTGRDDIELWVTEMNTLYGIYGFGVDRAERQESGTAVAALAMEEIAAGATVVQQWSTLENWFFGFLTDARSLGKRCTFHPWRLLAGAAGGDLVEAEVSGPVWDLDDPVPTMAALSGIPALRALAVAHPDHVDLLLANTLVDAGLAVEVRTDGTPDGDATVTRVAARSPAARDIDPEDGLFPWTAGVVGEAVGLDAGRPLWLPIEGRLRAEAGTVELWVRPDWTPGDGVDHPLFSLGYSLQMLATGDGWFGVVLPDETDPDEVVLLFASVASWRAGQWHHVALTWDAAAIRLYLDGLLVAESARDVVWNWIDPVPGLIVGSGLFTRDEGWDGAVDEIRLLSRPSTAAEIAADAAMGRAGRPLPQTVATTALLHLDGTIDNVVRDERTRVTEVQVPARDGAYAIRIPPAGFVRVRLPRRSGG